MVENDRRGIQSRVAGSHDIRLDGMIDLEVRARGCSVLDVGCNRGMVGYRMYQNGARAVHGCDIYEPGILTAREVFADLRSVESKFEVVDLTRGASALQVFGAYRYDIVLVLATYHKLKRVMQPEPLAGLMRDLGRRTDRWFAWRGTSYQADENEQEMANLDRDLGACKLRRVHTSSISEELGLCAIWAR